MIYMQPQSSSTCAVLVKVTLQVQNGGARAGKAKFLHQLRWSSFRNVGVSSLLHPPQPPLEVVLHLVSMDMFSSYQEISNFDTKLLKQIVQSVHMIATLHMQLS